MFAETTSSRTRSLTGHLLSHEIIANGGPPGDLRPPIIKVQRARFNGKRSSHLRPKGSVGRRKVKNPLVQVPASHELALDDSDMVTVPVYVPPLKDDCTPGPKVWLLMNGWNHRRLRTLLKNTYAYKQMVPTIAWLRKHYIQFTVRVQHPEEIIVTAGDSHVVIR